MIERAFFFDHAGERLCAVATLPDSGKADIGVVMLHGWTTYRIGPHRFFVKLARHLAERGVASIRFDTRGRGDSTGDHRETTLDSMIDDTVAAGRQLAELAGAGRIVYAGLCSGGNVALGAATLDPDASGVAAMSTLMFMEYKGMSESVRRTSHYGKEYLKKVFRAETWKKLFRGAIRFDRIRRVLFGHYGKKKRLDDPRCSGRDIMADFAQADWPALFVYGDRDPEGMASKPQFEQFCREHGLDAEFVDVAGANHDFYSLAWEREVFERMTAWLQKRFQSGASPISSAG